jgi:hypothetical protein
MNHRTATIHLAFLVSATTIAMVNAGCAYSHATISFREHPDLRAVHIYGGWAEERPLEAIGKLQAVREGRNCSDLSIGALQDLLEEARALGGNAVHAVQFRARWNWTGRAVCRPKGPLGIGGYTVSARGLAYFDPQFAPADDTAVEPHAR